MTEQPKFRETSAHTTDEKGRLALPARFREVVRGSGQEAVVLTRMERSLVGYTLPEWRVMEERVMAMPPSEDGAQRYLKRFFLGAAQTCATDKQGRILIPATLRDFAAIGTKAEIVLVGVMDHFEMWSRAGYDKEYESFQDAIAAGRMAQPFARLGL